MGEVEVVEVLGVQVVLVNLGVREVQEVLQVRWVLEGLELQRHLVALVVLVEVVVVQVDNMQLDMVQHMR